MRSLGACLRLTVLLLCTCGEKPDVEFMPTLACMPECCLTLDGNRERISCLEPYFRHVVQTRSAAEALCEAEAWALDGTLADCHEIAHWIGEEALLTAGGLAGAFAACDRPCIQGCYHGLMASYLKTERVSFEQFAQTVGALCEDLTADPLLFRQCIHGVGHGLMNYASLLDAIDVCQTGDLFFSDACLGGVLMENVDHYLSQSEARLRESIPTMCAELEISRVYDMCVAAIGEGMMFYTGYELDRGLDLCTSLDGLDDVHNCQSAVHAEYNANKLQTEALCTEASSS